MTSTDLLFRTGDLIYILRLVNTRWVISLATSDNKRSSSIIKTKFKFFLLFLTYVGKIIFFII